MADTVSNLLRKMISLLREKGVFEPEVSAERIMSSFTGLKRSELYVADETLIYNPAIHDIKAAVERRIAGEPVAYITGESEFYNIKLKIDRRVMVPRPETEILVDEVISILKGKSGHLSVADIGTGSGNIAIAIACNIEEVRIIATDTSASALELAEENARLNGVEDKIEFRRGDLLTPLSNIDYKFDAIVSNPPYVAEGDKDILPVEVRRYEPFEALFAGEDGLDAIRTIIRESPLYLKAGGLLALEIGYNQAAPVNELMKSDFMEVKIKKDLAGRDRVLLGYLPE
jgi:release factor glutamine methyltransferase